MSKKKAATTMRLKDFHGGSIPSDLPLPSAPGLSARPTQERSTTSIPSRSRQMAPSHASTSPLPAPPRMIGRHFDEDERTPFDAPPQRPSAPPASGAWAARKDQSNPATCPPNPVSSPTVWSPSKVAQASAVEKVISGRWLSNSNSKSDAPAPPVSPPVDSVKPRSDAWIPPVSDSLRSDIKLSEPIKSSKADVWSPPISDSIRSNLNISEPTEEINPLIRAHGSGFERPVARSGVIGENRVLKSPVNINQETRSGETKAGLEEFHPFRQGFLNRWENNQEMRPKSVGSRSAVDFEGKEIGRPVSHEGRFGEERPKLRLLPRSRPVEASGEGKMVILEGGEEGGEGSERPRLNLKPRSQIGGNPTDENKRQSVFGGARPRELVLKDRGVDQVPQEPEKILPSSQPNSATLEPTQFKPTEKRSENPQRNTRNPNPNPNPNTNPNSSQRTNWRAPHQQQPSRPEPDSWRKPEPPAKQEAPRVGKGASALELAQAFSKPGNEIPVLRNEKPALFSRLLGGEREAYNNRAPHQQINGY
ncbi:hypothetical protein LUZ60_010661 [Juncus effusus]|nr:hypothetical protein LUZ60_010661 [Juncus effusus]